jgi:hypothetical protein
MAKGYWIDWSPFGSYRTEAGAKTAGRNYSKNMRKGNFRVTKKAVRNKKGVQYNNRYNLWFVSKLKK